MFLLFHSIDLPGYVRVSDLPLPAEKQVAVARRLFACGVLAVKPKKK
jgi:hypothetical protein